MAARWSASKCTAVGSRYFSAVIDAVQPVGVLLNNSFAGLTLDSLHFELEIGETLAQARITGLRLSPPDPKAGQRVSLQATLQPYRAEPITERMELNLPRASRTRPLRRARRQRCGEYGLGSGTPARCVYTAQYL